jgi:hypothetical protein
MASTTRSQTDSHKWKTPPSPSGEGGPPIRRQKLNKCPRLALEIIQEVVGFASGGELLEEESSLEWLKPRENRHVSLVSQTDLLV